VIEESSGLSTSSSPPLTSFVRGAGCGCKLPAAELHALLRDLPTLAGDRVLVGFRAPTTRR
jgi:selenide,water dikinase